MIGVRPPRKRLVPAEIIAFPVNRIVRLPEEREEKPKAKPKPKVKQA
jgi:hypothetical protein